MSQCSVNPVGTVAFGGEDEGLIGLQEAVGAATGGRQLLEIETLRACSWGDGEKKGGQ